MQLFRDKNRTTTDHPKKVLGVGSRVSVVSERLGFLAFGLN